MAVGYDVVEQIDLSLSLKTGCQPVLVWIAQSARRSKMKRVSADKRQLTNFSLGAGAYDG
jgi:hypothetical protein